MNVKTVALSGAEQAINIGGSHAEIKNNGTDTIYASSNSGIVAGADGVVSIPAGAAVTVLDTRGTVYLLGTGSVEVVGKDFVSQVFKTAASSGGAGGTEDEVARNAINAHAGNAGIHVTADEKSAWNAKADLSDIPTSLPANGGNADTANKLVDAHSSGTKIALRWRGTDPDVNIVKYVAVWDSTDDLNPQIAPLPLSKLTAGNALTLESHPASDFALKTDIPTSLPANGGNADTLGGKNKSDFVENMLNQNMHFSMVHGDHAYITNSIDADVPNVPVVSNYVHIITRNSDGKVQSVLSIGVDFAENVYVFQAGRWKKINDGGNATSVGSYTESKIAALEARIAALEGK